MSASVPKTVKTPHTKSIRLEKGFGAQKKFYMSLLLQNPDSQMAKRFLREAKISKKELDQFKVKSSSK